MQKIVILADGQVAKSFLTGVFNAHLHEGAYEVIYFNDETLPDNFPDFVKKHKFDPTSDYKLAKVVTSDVAQVYIVLQNKMDAEVCIKSVSEKAHAAQIIVLNMWGLQKKAQGLKFVDANQTLSAQLLRYLPSALPIAQNVGLGLGEIVEAQAIYGSKYVFRHISTIEQKNWRIAAIYRHNQLILPKPNFVIRPNDSLLLVGQPAVLKDMHKAFRSELGQFPQPFGSAIYLLIDSTKLSKERLSELLENATYLKNKVKSGRFVVRVLRPTLESEDFIRENRNLDAFLEIDYKDEPIQDVILNDFKKYNVGLIIVCESFFAKVDNRKILHEIKKPVFKIGREKIADINKAVIALDKNSYWEAISGAFFDVAAQLNLEAKILNFENDSAEDIIEHYQNLANLYSIKLEIETKNINALRYLTTKSNMLHVLPLNFKTISLSLKDIFFPEAPQFLRLLSSKNQLYIPI